MKKNRNGEWATGRNGEAPDWWGEAPERPDRRAGESDVFRRTIPLLQRACRAVMQRQTTARRDFRRIDTIRREAAGCSGPILRSFGSLAPPTLSPMSRLVVSPIRPFAPSPP